MQQGKPGRPPSGASVSRGALYALLLALSVGAFLVIRRFGLSLTAPAPGPTTDLFGAPGGPHNVDALMHVLLALAVIIVTARAVGYLFALLHQPAVIGEVLAGILLGPSLLGRVAPSVSGYVLPQSVAPFLGVLSQVGVVLYMFLVGLELDFKLMRKSSHAMVAISHASIVTPFLLGSALALILYPRLSTGDVPFTVFALFCGVAMSVTAFPVLARILTDRGTHTSRMGVIALTCAAVDDVTAWCLLAFVVGVAQTRVGGGLLTGVLSVGYITAMLVLARPAVRKLVEIQEHRGEMGKGVLAVIFVGMLLSSLATELIGIHAIFGAFVLGALVPHDSRVARELTAKLEDVVVVLLLPAFFAYTGMRTKLGLVSGADQWALCALIIVAASVGKFGGSSIAARATGLPWVDSAALGILMNTRGLMELVVLNIGLDLRVISPTLFAMLVIMALVTTMATTPVLQLLSRVSRPPDSEDGGAYGEDQVPIPASKAV
jgi:Kef-type K+ transport system membrane component KefB